MTNRLIGYQADLLGGPEVPVWSRGRPPAEPRARKRDPKTSKDAALSARDTAQKHRDIILACLKVSPGSKDQIAARTKLTGVQVGRRLKELETAGSIRPSGKTAISAAGREERVMEAV